MMSINRGAADTMVMLVLAVGVIECFLSKVIANPMALILVILAALVIGIFATKIPVTFITPD